MSKNSYEIRAQKFIREIYPFIMYHDTHCERERAVDLFNALKHRKVHYANGLTRFALITSDYVVKVDYDEEAIESFGGCENEVARYQEAEQDGFAYLFAKITRYEYRGHKFYIMPRINGINRTWMDADYYMTEQESDWCNEHNLCDLHCANYGWKGNHIVIVDYAATW